MGQARAGFEVAFGVLLEAILMCHQRLRFLAIVSKWKVVTGLMKGADLHLFQRPSFILPPTVWGVSCSSYAFYLSHSMVGYAR